MKNIAKIIFPVIIFSLNACHSWKDKENIRIKQNATRNKQSNIIYIIANVLAMEAISAYNSLYKEIAPTPNIDLLDNEGMLFRNMTSTNAIYCPSRACILTGD